MPAVFCLLLTYRELTAPEQETDGGWVFCTHEAFKPRGDTSCVYWLNFGQHYLGCEVLGFENNLLFFKWFICTGRMKGWSLFLIIWLFVLDGVWCIAYLGLGLMSHCNNEDPSPVTRALSRERSLGYWEMTVRAHCWVGWWHCVVTMWRGRERDESCQQLQAPASVHWWPLHRLLLPDIVLGQSWPRQQLHTAAQAAQRSNERDAEDFINQIMKFVCLFCEWNWVIWQKCLGVMCLCSGSIKSCDMWHVMIKTEDTWSPWLRESGRDLEDVTVTDSGILTVPVPCLSSW